MPVEVREPFCIIPPVPPLFDSLEARLTVPADSVAPLAIVIEPLPDMPGVVLILRVPDVPPVDRPRVTAPLLETKALPAAERERDDVLV